MPTDTRTEAHPSFWLTKAGFLQSNFKPFSPRIPDWFFKIKSLRHITTLLKILMTFYMRVKRNKTKQNKTLIDLKLSIIWSHFPISRQYSHSPLPTSVLGRAYPLLPCSPAFLGSKLGLLCTCHHLTSPFKGSTQVLPPLASLTQLNVHMDLRSSNIRFFSI